MERDGINYFQSDIQENKDWNCSGTTTISSELYFQSDIQENKDWNCIVMDIRVSFATLFQSDIQENKDWNLYTLLHTAYFHLPFRATSKRTRIETKSVPVLYHRSFCLSERHPREQGLKLPQLLSRCLSVDAFRATSKRTRSETTQNTTVFSDIDHFQSDIQENKDWNKVNADQRCG